MTNCPYCGGEIPSKDFAVKTPEGRYWHYPCADKGLDEWVRLKDELAALREENDQQRHSIQQLSAQVADYRKVIINCPIEAQDGCNCSDCKAVRNCENILYTHPNPGADLLAKIERLEAVARLIETDMGGCYQDFAWKCDNCSEAWTLVEGTPEDNLYKYCPNCGAKIIEYVPYIEGPADE